MSIGAPADLDRHVGRYYGKYSGVVADEADSTKRGVLQVKIPPVFGPDTVVSARPCFPYGHYFVPPAGTKVWVEFEAGDPGHPLWVGTWFADGEVPPEAAVDPPDARVIQTASGHTIQLDDTSGSEKVLVRHKSDAFISMDADGGVLLANKSGAFVFLNAAKGEVSVVSQNGQLLSMTSDGVVLADQNGNAVSMTSSAINVAGSGQVNLMGNTVGVAGGSVTLGANASQHLVVAELLAAAFMQHTHPTALGPTGPPVPPLLPTAISSTSVTVTP
jgi:hypothetical protein